MLRRLIGENIELAWRPGGGVWPVRIDPTQLDQILANLCVNARDAIDGVGRVTLATANRTLLPADCADRPGYVAGDYVCLSVADTGRGIEPSALGKIFEPFYTTKGSGRGTGLGLATVYGIVKQNSGLIGVESVVGAGTTFEVLLPRHLPALHTK
jgi:signal transduction histidine kinase